jgi:hypothetical protein
MTPLVVEDEKFLKESTGQGPPTKMYDIFLVGKIFNIKFEKLFCMASAFCLDH